jgi:hypothetical protein
MFFNQSERKKASRFSYHAIFIFLFTGSAILPQSAADHTAAQRQTAPRSEQPGVLAPDKTAQGEDKYAFGVLPNYRTAEKSSIGHPLTAEQKVRIAAKDSFALPLLGLGAAYAGLYQLMNSHPQFGQGMEGYAKRLGTSYTDQVLGNMMTEGIYPSLLKQDPRYFRMAEGSRKARTWYALTRIFVSRTDSGNTTVNYSELLGNATAAAIGLSYYSDNRNAHDYVLNWGTQLGTDATSQVLKEFWPDVKRLWQKKRAKEAAMMAAPRAQL